MVSVLCKFGVNVSFDKIQLFKKATEKFVKERPREWIALLGFRATRCEQDLGFIEYTVVLQVSHLRRHSDLMTLWKVPSETLSTCSTAKVGRILVPSLHQKQI